MRNFAALVVSSLVLAGCASAPQPELERGWIGGRFADVTRERVSNAIDPHYGAIDGMPASAAGETAALVTAALAGTPLANAGVVPGDLVLSLDGRPVEDGFDLRQRVKSLAPGSHTQLAYWRDGETRTADVVAGRETYEPEGRITIGLALEPVLDLWPFNDGIDVLGLVRIRWDQDRHDFDDPVVAYRREVRPHEEIVLEQQESFEVFVVPLGVSKGKRVIRQETLP